MYAMYKCSSIFQALLHDELLFSNINERDHVLQPYSTTGNISVLYILTFKLLERSREDKRVWTE